MFPRYANDVRFDAQDWRRAPCHGAEGFLFAGQCALLASIAGFAGVLSIVLLN